MQPGSTPLSGPAVSPLPHAVNRYKLYYYWLLGISGLLLISIIVYIVLWKQETSHAYLSLDKKTRLSKTMAVDSSGKMIAAVTFNTVDSTTGIIVSEDGGKHFQQWGGPWKTTIKAGNNINHIYIAPDNKSIIAIGSNVIYAKAAGADSFTVIRNLIDNIDLMRLIGTVFSNISDSAFVFSRDSIYAFRYSKYDSVSIGYFKDINSVVSLKTGTSSNLFAGVGKSIYTGAPGVFVNYRFSRAAIFPVSFFNGKPTVYAVYDHYNDIQDKVLNNDYPQDATLPDSSDSKNAVKQ